MAINIYSEPNDMSTPYRPCYFDVSSDLGTIVRMIADVYVGGTLVTTIDKDPIISTTNTFRFDVGDALQKYLFSEYHDVTANFQDFDCITSANNYYIRAFEVEDNGTTLDTSWTAGGGGTNYAQSTTLYTFNGVNQHEQLLSNRILDSSTGKFLTNRPQNTSVSSLAELHLGMLTAVSSANGVKYTLEQYDGLNGSGSLVDSSASAGINHTNYKVTFGILMSELDASTKSIKVNGNNATSDQQLTEQLVMNVVTPCDESTTVYWQNHWGEFDNFTFGGRKTQKTKTRTTSIENRLNLDYEFSDRGEVDIKKVNNRDFTIYTRTLSKATILWLAEIGESVDVKILRDGNNIPINVTSVKTTIEDTENGVHQISITYNEANQRINQLG